MRVGCSAGLDRDLGVVVEGNVSDVRYNVSMGKFKAAVDWASITNIGGHLTDAEIARAESHTCHLAA
jgi:hypothetical protein